MGVPGSVVIDRKIRIGILEILQFNDKCYNKYYNTTV